MKGQDIGLLLKLVCLQRHESRDNAKALLDDAELGMMKD
jgi:hypothetical protein